MWRKWLAPSGLCGAPKVTSISPTSEITLLFKFELEVDANKVILSEPWSYDRHLVIFRRFGGSKALKEIEFKSCSFWIQIHDVPFKFLTPETAVEIGETIGTVSKQRETSEIVGGMFLRVRIKLSTKGWKGGYHSNMNGSLTYVFGVECYCTMKKNVKFG